MRQFLIGRTALHFGYACSSIEGFRRAPGFPGRSVNCTERGHPHGFPPAPASGFPPAERSQPLGLGFWASGPPGSSLVSVRSGCLRFSVRGGPAGVSPLTWTARYVLGFPCWESNWQDYCPGSSVNRPGRNWASGSTTGLIICAINDG